jgi:hypothetical protein
MIELAERETSEGVFVVEAGDPPAPLAVRVTTNPLADGWRPPETVAPALVIWSGTLADDLFAPHPHNWLPPGRAALDAVCERLLGADLGGPDLLIRPHCRHVLSDVPSCRRFLADHEDWPVGLALAPRDLLEDGMLSVAADHLERIFAALGGSAKLVYLDGLDDLDGVDADRVEELRAEHAPAAPCVRRA